LLKHVDNDESEIDNAVSDVLGQGHLHTIIEPSPVLSTGRRNVKDSHKSSREIHAYKPTS